MQIIFLIKKYKRIFLEIITKKKSCINFSGARVLRADLVPKKLAWSITKKF